MKPVLISGTKILPEPGYAAVSKFKFRGEVFNTTVQIDVEFPLILQDQPVAIDVTSTDASTKRHMTGVQSLMMGVVFKRYLKAFAKSAELSAPLSWAMVG